jgi:hypothetical protein
MTEVRLCGFCRKPVAVEHDNESIRVYRCTDAACDAVEVISKGKSWWYHGWEAPDGKKITGDGKREQRPERKRFEWWRVYTEGADYETLRREHRA